MPGINIINIEEEDEPLKGRPRTVRLQKTDYQLGRSVALLAIVTDHDSNGNVTERRVYRPDGTLSFHESSQYEADPPGCTVRILNAQGEIVSTRRILTGFEGEESIVTSALGEISQKTRTRRDPEGRVIEAVSEEMVGNKEIRMLVDYDAGQGEAHVTLPEGSNIHILAGPDGTRVRYRDSSGHEHEFPGIARRTVIQSTDEKGNWTSKTIVERDPATGNEVVVASMDRAITYYSD
ncbi:MAG TPA: hypothetical protein VK686_18910 [Bryobacteraceae bacterium]|nr:hypothetical protein [Bryobacteraceae bacterium]